MFYFIFFFIHSLINSIENWSIHWWSLIENTCKTQHVHNFCEEKIIVNHHYFTIHQWNFVDRTLDNNNKKSMFCLLMNVCHIITFTTIIKIMAVYTCVCVWNEIRVNHTFFFTLDQNQWIDGISMMMMMMIIVYRK